MTDEPYVSLSTGGAHIVEQTARACSLTASAIKNAAKLLLTGEQELLGRIGDVEQELDRLDLAVDDEMPSAVANARPEQARLLLVCMKFIIDLERIGDLIAGFSTRAAAVYKEIGPADLADLAQMLAVLDQMMTGVLEGYTSRRQDRVMEVIRRDAEVDRLRNLLLLRHLESQETSNRQSIHVLIMAQSLERVGDHLKNLAEEVCHLVSGRTMRHVLRSTGGRSAEQLFIDWLKQKHAVAS
jgi:phosphate transport system protein